MELVRMNDTEYNPWIVIEAYFKGQHLKRCVRHKLESYNYFVNHQIQQTIDMFNPVTIRSEQDYNKELDKYALELILSFNHHSLHPFVVFTKLIANSIPYSKQPFITTST